jgi:hypothetical protein
MSVTREFSAVFAGPLWSLAAAGAALAQPAVEPPTLVAGGTVTRPAIGPGAGVEVFQPRGAVGARLTSAVAGAGAFKMTLYTPEGAPMLTVQAIDAGRLVAFLPLDGTYRLSIARRDSARPYTLALASEPPADIIAANSRLAIGYEVDNPSGPGRSRRCWIEPGVKLRILGVDPEMTVTELGHGTTRTDYLLKGKPQQLIMKRRIEDGEIVFSPQGLKTTYRSKPFPTQGNPIYKGYLCEPSAAVPPAPLTPFAPPVVVAAAPKATQPATSPPPKRTAFRPPFAPPVFVK